MKLACQQEQHNPKQPKVKFIPRWRLEKNNTVCTKNKEILIYVDDVTSQDCPSLRKKQCFKKIFLTVISLSLKVQWWKAYPLSPILKWGLKTSQKKNHWNSHVNEWWPQKFIIPLGNYLPVCFQKGYCYSNGKRVSHYDYPTIQITVSKS